MKELGNEYKVAVIGEIMMTRPISVFTEPDFLSVIKLLRDADVAVTNMEGLPTCFKGQQGLTGGTPMSGESWAPDEFKWMGLNLVSIANNHTKDYGDGGLLAALEVLEKSQLAHAGSGRDLWEARQPAYLETKKGRAAMVATTSFAVGGRDINMATETGLGVLGRPGVNPLRYDVVYTVKPNRFAELKKINEEWGVPGLMRPSPLRPKIDKEEISFLGNRIVAGDKPGVQQIPLQKDVEGNLQSIRNAKGNSNLVVASNHGHETDPTLRNEWGEHPAAFIKKYAKDCIDAGADVFYGHGCHTGLGIEIYKGKPIIYSLATPIVESLNIKRLSLEEYERYGLSPEKATIAEWMRNRWELGGGAYADDRWVKTLVVTFTMKNGKLTELKLHPIDTTAGESPGTFVHRGVRPLMAKGEEAKKILERYAAMSSPFGTKVDIEKGVGIVKV